MAEHRDEAAFRVWYEEVYCKEEAESSCSQPFVVSVQPLLNSFACCLFNFFKDSLAYLRHPVPRQTLP